MVTDSDDAGDLSDGDRVYRPPPERPRPAGKGRRVAAAAVGPQQNAKASSRRGKAPDGPTAQANAARAASAALPGSRRPSWLTELTEARPRPPQQDAASDASPRREAGRAGRGRGGRGGAAPGRRRAAVGGAPPPAHPKKRRRRLRRIDLDAEDSEATVSDDGALRTHSRDSDATQSDEEQLTLPPKKRRTVGQQARVASSSAAAPHPEPVEAAPSVPEPDEEYGAAMDYEPAYSPPVRSPPSRAASQVPTLRLAALPGQFADGTPRDPAPGCPAQQNSSSTTAPAAGGSSVGADQELSPEVVTAVPSSQPAAIAATTEDDPRGADGDACGPSSTPQQEDVTQQQQKLTEAAAQDRCDRSPKAEQGADDEASRPLGSVASPRGTLRQEANEKEANVLQDDAARVDVQCQSHSPRSSVPGEDEPQRAQPLPGSDPAVTVQSRCPLDAAANDFERVELQGSPASSVQQAGRDSRSQQPMATPPTAFERAELPPSPDTSSDEHHANPSRPSQRSQPSTLRQLVFPPQGPAFERAELPRSPSPAPQGAASAQRDELPPAPALSRGDAAPLDATFQRQELPQSPSPGAGAQMPRTEAQSEQGGRPASAASIRGHDGVAFRGAESPASPLPDAAPRAAQDGSALPWEVQRWPPAHDSDASAPARRMFQREETPSSPSPGARPPVSSGANFHREELPFTPPSSGGPHRAASRAVFQREELPVSPPQARGAPTPAAAIAFQRVDLSPSPPQTHRADTAAPHAVFERGELPPSPMAEFIMGAAAAEIGANLQHEELPPAPAGSDITLLAPSHQNEENTSAQSPVASAAASAPPQQASAAFWALHAQPSEDAAHVQTAQPSARTSPNGRSAKATAWLQRRGKLPPMQARARVSQH